MIYLDNCATTPLDPAAAECMARASKECFGNPSSIHAEGRKAAKVLSDSRARLAESIHAQPKEIVLVSSGTEANNLVIASVVQRYAREGLVHIVTSTTEHASVTNRLDWEVRQNPPGVEVTYVGVDSQGRLRRDELRAAIRPETRLLTLLHCNNETGVLQDLDAIAAIKHAFPSLLLHLDIVQSYMKMCFDVRTLPADFLTVSSHKICGPKGMGFVYVRDGVDVEPLIVGGAQEKYRRAGTENVVAAAGFACAVEMTPSCAELGFRFLRFERAFLTTLEQEGASFLLNGPENHVQRMPGLFSLSFPGVRSKEDLQIACDLEGVMLSSTSACHSGVLVESHVLKAMGLAPERLVDSVRVCFNKFLSDDEIRTAAKILARVAKRLTNQR